MAGEIYTFHLPRWQWFRLWAWRAGLLHPSYGGLAYVLSYWLLPPIWRYAKEHRLITQPDFFARKYDSPALGVLVAVVGIVALVPYLVLQLKGLGIIVDTAAYGARISPTAAIWIGAGVVTAYVTVSGITDPPGQRWSRTPRSLPSCYSWAFTCRCTTTAAMARCSRRSRQQNPLPGAAGAGRKPGMVHSTVLLTALGFYMWPHTFGSLYTAKEERAFRRNAAMLPLYQLITVCVLCGASLRSCRFRA